MPLSFKRKITITAINTGIDEEVVEKAVLEYLRVDSQTSLIHKLNSIVTDYPPTVPPKFPVEVDVLTFGERSLAAAKERRGIDRRKRD